MANTKNTPDSTSTKQRGQETTFKNTTPQAHAGQQPGDRDAPQDPSRKTATGTQHDAIESDVNVPHSEGDRTASNTGQNPASPRGNEGLRDEDEADLHGDLSDDTIDVEDDADTDLHTDGDAGPADPATPRS